MQKRKLFLSLLALCSIVGMGITSCNNQGEQGPIGPEGPQGPEGPAGEDGQDGQDGSLILTGEGKPADTLGKDTDIYIDSKTGDLYQKANGTWTLVMNINGEDGSNGSSGSSGQDGETAWSNTILPSEGGYVLPSIGSGKVNDEISFSVFPEDGYILDSLTLNEETYLIEDLLVEGDHYVLETKMCEGGFVVSANFKSSEESNVWHNGKFYTKAVFNINGELVESESSLDSSYPAFASGDGVNTPLLINEETTLTSEQAQKFADNLDYEVNIVGENNTFDQILKVFETDVDADLIKINIAENSTLNLSEGYSLNANNFVIKGDGTTSKINKTVNGISSSEKTSTVFRFNNINGDEEDFKIDISGVDFVANCGDNGSSFIRVDAYKDVEMSLKDVSFKTSSTSVIYGIQVIGNKGHVDLNFDNLVIDLRDMNQPDALVKSYYPLNLQNNEGLTAHISNSEFTGWGGIYVKDNKDTIYADNCTFNVVNNVSDNLYSFSAIVFDGGEILNPPIGEVGLDNYMEVSNSTFNLKNSEGYGGLNFASFQYNAKSNHLKFVDNVYNASGNEKYNSQISFTSNSGNTFELIDNGVTTLINDEALNNIKLTSSGEEESGKIYKIESDLDIAKVIWWCDENGHTECESTSDDPLTYINGDTIETQLHDVSILLNLSSLNSEFEGDYVTLSLNIQVK